MTMVKYNRHYNVCQCIFMIWLNMSDTNLQNEERFMLPIRWTYTGKLRIHYPYTIVIIMKNEPLNMIACKLSIHVCLLTVLTNRQSQTYTRLWWCVLNYETVKDLYQHVDIPYIPCIMRYILFRYRERIALSQRFVFDGGVFVRMDNAAEYW